MGILTSREPRQVILLSIVVFTVLLSGVVLEVRAWQVLQHVTCKDMKGTEKYETYEPVEVTSRFSTSDEKVCLFWWADFREISRSTAFRVISNWYDPEGSVFKRDSSEIYGNIWKGYRTLTIKGRTLKIGKWATEFLVDGGPFRNEVLFKDFFTIGIKVLKIQLRGVPSSASTNALVDGKLSGAVPGTTEASLEVTEDEAHTVAVDEYVSGTSGTRYHCTANTWTVVQGGSLEESHQFSYDTEYKLTVDSLYGQVAGDGWYKDGSTASFSISSVSFPSGVGVQNVFERWSGDSTSTLPQSTIVMNAPKTVVAVWRTDYTGLIIMIVSIVGLSTGGVVFLTYSLRREIVPAAPLGVVHPEAPSAIPAKPAPETSAAVKQVKEIPPPKITLITEDTSLLDDRVYNYIVEHGGEIALSQAAKDLGISLDELRASIDRLKEQGKLV